MSLFKPSDIEQTVIAPKPKAGAKSVLLVGSGAELNSLAIIRDTIGKIAEGESVPYFTKGAWSNHDLLEYLVTELAGPSEVWLSTWGIGEEAFRRIHHLMSEGWITGLNCLFDHRISQQKAKELQLVQGIATRIVYMKNHSKVLAIRGRDASFSIYTSANMNHNPRMEAGVIIRSTTITDFTSGYISGEIEGN